MTIRTARRVGVMVVMLLPVAVRAQAPPPEVTPSWQTAIRPYFFLTGLSGSVTADTLTFPINSRFGDLLDNLRISVMVSATAEKGAWGAYADFQYISLRGETTGPAGSSLELKNLIGEGDVTYRPIRSTGLRFLAGVRIYSVDQTLNIGDQLPIEANTTVADPILGALGNWQLSPDFNFEMRVDVGGFGLGSEFTNQMFGVFLWRVSDRVQLPFGYRVLGYQIKTEDIWMNTRMGGLLVGVDIQL